MGPNTWLWGSAAVAAVVLVHQAIPRGLRRTVRWALIWALCCIGMAGILYSLITSGVLPSPPFGD